MSVEDGPVTTSPVGTRRVWPFVIVAVGLVVALFGAIVALRLTREASLPPPPHAAVELGVIPASNEPWDTVIRQRDDWLVVPEESLLREELSGDLPGERLPGDRAAVETLLARVDRAGWAELEARVDAAFTGVPLVDGCGTAPSECDSLPWVRAAQLAVVVAVSRWAVGDRAGAARLLAAVMVSAMGLARTGRDSMTQTVGLVVLSRAVTVAFALDRIDRAEGQALDPTLATTLHEVSTLEVDLGRGWIGESLWVEPLLRDVIDGAQTRTLLFFDEGAAARELYETYDACVAYARGEQARPPPMANIPGVSDVDFRMAPLDALQLIDGVPLECGAVLELGMSNLRISRERARGALER